MSLDEIQKALIVKSFDPVRTDGEDETMWFRRGSVAGMNRPGGE